MKFLKIKVFSYSLNYKRSFYNIQEREVIINTKQIVVLGELMNDIKSLDYYGNGLTEFNYGTLEMTNKKSFNLLEEEYIRVKNYLEKL